MVSTKQVGLYLEVKSLAIRGGQLRGGIEVRRQLY